MQANLAFLQAEEATASNCSRAWASMRKFESFFPNVTIGADLDQQYLSSRPQCLALAKQLAESMGLSEALALDAVLMLDRLVHQSQDLFSQVGKESLLDRLQFEPYIDALLAFHACMMMTDSLSYATA